MASASTLQPGTCHVAFRFIEQSLSLSVSLSFSPSTALAMAARAPAKRREVEDPNNTWDMQLVAALLRKDTAEASNLLTKGAKINHTAVEPNSKMLLTPYHTVAMRATPTNTYAEFADVLAWCVSQGADVNVPVDASKATFIHYLVKADASGDALDKYLAACAHGAPDLDVSLRDASGVTPMQQAINTGRWDTARLLTRHHGLLRHDFREGVDATHGSLAARAVALADVPLIEGLLLAGENPLFLDATSGQTLVHLALGLPTLNLPMLDALLERCGAGSVNVFNAHGHTPLIHAITQLPLRLDIVDALIARGADVNLGDNVLGMSPVMHAISMCQADVIRKLVIDGKAEVVGPNAARDFAGRTALHWAVAARSRVILEQLLALEACDANATDAEGGTPLLRACELPDGDDYVALLLSKESTDVNAQDATFRDSALHKAVARRATSTVKLLLTRLPGEKDAAAAPTAAPAGGSKPKPGGKKGAPAAQEPPAQSRLQIDGVNKAGLTPLQCAVQVTRDAGVAALLIHAGANIHRVTAAGSSLLQEAVTDGGSVALVLALIQKGAQVNFRNAEDLTALQLAARHHVGRTDLVEPLLAAGAETNDRDCRFLKSPLHIACDHGDVAVMTLLLQHDGGASSACDVVKPIDTRSYTSLVNLTDSRLRTALHVASRRGDSAAASLLLQRGARVDARDDSGRRPLHGAVMADAVDCVALLVAAGASVWDTDDGGRAPLHVAIAAGAENAVKFLLELTEKRQASVDAEARVRGDDERRRQQLALDADGAAARASFLRDEAARLEDRQWSLGLTQPDALGLTPMLIAAQSGQPNCAKLLLRTAGRLKLLGPTRKAA